MAKNYFAVVHKKTGTLLVNSGRLPIYWYKSAAQFEATHYKDHIVQPININDFNKLILPKPKAK